MNADRAAELGISDGDEVLVENEHASGRTRVKVTGAHLPGRAVPAEPLRLLLA